MIVTLVVFEFFFFFFFLPVPSGRRASARQHSLGHMHAGACRGVAVAAVQAHAQGECMQQAAQPHVRPLAQPDARKNQLDGTVYTVRPIWERSMVPRLAIR